MVILFSLAIHHLDMRALESPLTNTIRNSLNIDLNFGNLFISSSQKNFQSALKSLFCCTYRKMIKNVYSIVIGQTQDIMCIFAKVTFISR